MWWVVLGMNMLLFGELVACCWGTCGLLDVLLGVCECVVGGK